MISDESTEWIPPEPPTFDQWISGKNPQLRPRIVKAVQRIAFAIYKERGGLSTIDQQLSDIKTAQNIVMGNLEKRGN